jgi:hypothetical protein
MGHIRLVAEREKRQSHNQSQNDEQRCQAIDDWGVAKESVCKPDNKDQT